MLMMTSCFTLIIIHLNKLVAPILRLTVATKVSSVARSLKLSNVDLGQYLDG